MKKIDKIKGNKYVAYFLVLCGAILFYLLVSHVEIIGIVLNKILYYIGPFFAALVIAFLLNPLVRFFEKFLFKRMKNRRAARVLSTIIVTLLILGFFAFLVAVIVPSLFSTLNNLLGNIDKYFSSMESWLASLQLDFANNNINIAEMIGSLDGYIEKMVSWIKGNISTIVSTSVQIGSSVVNVALTAVITFYILIQPEIVKRLLVRFEHALFKKNTCEKIDTFYGYFKEISIKYIGGQLFDALIIGVSTLVFLLIFKVPYPDLFAVIAGVGNLVPTFGPIVYVVLCDVILVMINPLYALIFTIISVILQILDAYVIKPLLYKGIMGLPALWVLVSIVLGGRIFGFWGVMLALPVATLISIYIEKFLTKRENRKKDSDPTIEEYESNNTTSEK